MRFRQAEIAGAALQMHGFSPRASPKHQTAPRPSNLAPTSCNSIFRTGPASHEQRTSPEAHLRNRERMFHVPSLPSTNTSRRAERRRPQLGSTRRAGLDGRLLHSASPASPGLDHERAEDSRRANDGPLAESSQRHRGASRRRFPTTPYGATVESTRVAEGVARVYQQRQAVLRLCLDDVARHSCPPGPRRSAVPALQQCVAAEAPRDGAGNFRLHGASMRPMPRALVEF